MCRIGISSIIGRFSIGMLSDLLLVQISVVDLPNCCLLFPTLPHLHPSLHIPRPSVGPFNLPLQPIGVLSFTPPIPLDQNPTPWSPSTPYASIMNAMSIKCMRTTTYESIQNRCYRIHAIWPPGSPVSTSYTQHFSLYLPPTSPLIL